MLNQDIRLSESFRVDNIPSSRRYRNPSRSSWFYSQSAQTCSVFMPTGLKRKPASCTMSARFPCDKISMALFLLFHQIGAHTEHWFVASCPHMVCNENGALSGDVQLRETGRFDIGKGLDGTERNQRGTARYKLSVESNMITEAYNHEQHS